MKCSIKSKMIMMLGFSLGLSLMGEEKSFAQEQGEINRSIPSEVTTILTNYKPSLSKKFIEVLPIVAAEYEMKFLKKADKNSGKCTVHSQVSYGSEGLLDLIEAKNVELSENDQDFLNSISIIKGCEKFNTEDTEKLLTALITREHKMGFSPETVDFEFSGADICEKSKVKVSLLTIAAADACYRVSRFDEPVENMKKHGFSGFTTWDVKSLKVGDYDPISFRSTLMFVNGNGDGTTNLNFLVISRWNDFNSVEKKLSQGFVPNRMEKGFNYLHSIFDRN